MGLFGRSKGYYIVVKIGNDYKVFVEQKGGYKNEKEAYNRGLRKLNGQLFEIVEATSATEAKEKAIERHHRGDSKAMGGSESYELME